MNTEMKYSSSQKSPIFCFAQLSKPGTDLESSCPEDSKTLYAQFDEVLAEMFEVIFCFLVDFIRPTEVWG